MSLASRTLRAIRWNAVGTAVRFAAQFGTSVVLARLLGPEAFGLVAAAMTVIAFGALVSDGGFGAASIVSERADAEDLASVQAVQMALAFVLMLALMSARKSIAAFYSAPRLAEVLPVLALQFPLQALSTAASVSLKRAMNFRAIQAAQTGAYVVGYAVVGIGLAAAGAGVWSLVVAHLVFVATNAIVLIAVSGFAPRFRLGLPRRETLRNGLGVALSNLGGWLNASVDIAFVGRLFGPVSLGFYSRASTLVTSPTTLLVSLVQSALLPAFAQARHRNAAVATPFVAAWSAVWLAGLPVATFVSVYAADITELLFGARWAPSAPLLAILAAMILLQALVAISSALLWGFDRVGREVVGQLASLGIMIGAIGLGVGRVDLRFIAAAVVTGVAVRVLGATWAAARALNIGVGRFVDGAARSFVLASAVIAVAVTIPSVGADRWAPLPKLSVAAAASGTFAIVLMVIAPTLCVAPDLRALLIRLSEGRPSSVAGRVLTRFCS